MIYTVATVMLALAPTLTLSQGYQAPLLVEIEVDKELDSSRRRIGSWNDGTLCLLGTTCASCANGSTWWWSKGIRHIGMTACGNEPKWNDGAKCDKGFSCKACENGFTYWKNKSSFACGTAPTLKPTPSPTASPSFSPTLSPTLLPTQVPTQVPTEVPSASPTPAPTPSPTPAPTYNIELNGECWSAGDSKASRDEACAGDLVCARMGFDGRHFGGCYKWMGKYKPGPTFTAHCCSKIPTVADGEKCIPGNTLISTCHKCKNPAGYWYSKLSHACGQEPQWKDGTICLMGTSCNRCKNKATFWWSKRSFACGKQ